MKRRLFHSTLILVTCLLGLSPVWAATVRGTVAFPTSQAATAIQLSFLNLETEDRAVVFTDSQGRFQLELPEGTYHLYVRRAAEQVFMRRLSLQRDDVRDLELTVQPEHVYERATRLQPTGRRAVKPQSPSNSPARRDHPNGVEDLAEQMARLEETVASEETPVAQLVNPFPAQRRGRWHGSIYEFHRNDNLDSRNFFDPLGQPLPEYKRNQFGASFGTTIANSLNLLGLYEGLRIIQGSTILSHIATPAMKRGDFSELDSTLRDPVSGESLPSNRVPDDRIHPVSRRLLPVLPDPNRSDPDRNFVNNQPSIRNRDWYSFQADVQPDDASKVFIRYSFVDGDQVRVHPLPQFGWQREDRHQNVTLSYTRSMTSRFITSGRVRFDRDTDTGLSNNAGQEGLLESLGISGLSTLDSSEEGYPEFSLAGYAGFGDRSSPAISVNNSYSLEGSVSYSPNNHNYRFGVDVDIRQVNNNRPGGSRRGRFSFNGYYSGDAFADFLFGLPDGAFREVGADRLDLRSKRWEFLFVDNWKVDPKLSFNYGVTYNYFEPYRSIRNNVSTFFPLLFEPPTDGEIVIAGSERALALGLGAAGSSGLVFPDRNDWSPQLGLAYSPFGSQELVLRATYSIYYSPPRRTEFLDSLGRNYPFHFVETAQSPVDQPKLDLSSPFETITPTELRIRSIEPKMRTRYTQYWRWSIQSEITQKWVAEASYRGSKGGFSRRLLHANVPLPGPGFVQARRPNPDFGSFEILTGSGSYVRHSLNLELERRLNGGLSLKSGFRWERLFSDSYRGAPSNPRDLRAERAPSTSTPTRRFFLNYIYDLPFGNYDTNGAARPLDWFMSGWRLSGITNIQDGTPFTVVSPGDPNNDGISGDRPNRTGSGLLDPSERSIDQWFQTDDFEMPQPFSFGNSGRNILAGPGFQNWDLSLIKRTALSDGELVELRVELFNAFNHPNFHHPKATLGTSPFGKIFGAHRAREIEIAVKYSF